MTEGVGNVHHFKPDFPGAFSLIENEVSETILFLSLPLARPHSLSHPYSHTSAEKFEVSVLRW